jgi:hypothetical protein
MSWFDSFNALHGSPKTIVDNGRDSEKSKSVAEIIDDIEKYNEKKKLKEKEEERAVVERLLELMKPEEEVVPILKTEIAIQAVESEIFNIVTAEVLDSIKAEVLALETMTTIEESKPVSEESDAKEILEDDKNEEGLANSPRKNIAAVENTAVKPASEIQPEPTPHSDDTPKDTEQLQTPLVTNPSIKEETPPSETQPTAAQILLVED